MRSDVGCIDHYGFHVGIAGEVFEHRFPDSAFRPAVEAFVNAVPVAVFLGQESPLDTAAGHVENGVNEAFASCWFADVEIGSGSQKF